MMMQRKMEEVVEKKKAIGWFNFSLSHNARACCSFSMP